MTKTSKLFINLLISAAALTASAADNLTIIVAGSKTGTITLASNMLVADGKQNLLGGRQIDLVEPGNACKGFTLASSQQNSETFLVPIENMYAENAKLKNDPLCVVPDTSKAIPVFTEVQAFYLVARKNLTLNDFKSKSLKIGYSSDDKLEKVWHEQMNKSINQSHQYIGYSGSGKLINGMLSGDVDICWITWTGYNSLLKSAPDTFVALASNMNEGRSETKVPVLADVLNDPAIIRGNVITWWMFNDKNNQSQQLSQYLESLHSKGQGEWGKWTKENGKILKFNAKEQRIIISAHAWNR